MPLQTPDVPTWESLITEVRSEPGSAARHSVGAWAMDQIRAALGETWPERWHGRFGWLPPFVGDPANNAIAYAQLVEAGLRLDRLAGTLRLKRLTKEWSQDLQEIRLLHVGLQLEVAALASSVGASVEFETPIQLPKTRRPADVVMSAEGEKLIAECFCVYTDDYTTDSMAYDQDFGFRLHMMAIDLRLSGHWDVRLPAAETEQLLAEVGQTVALVLADGLGRDVTRSGIELHLAPWSAPDGAEVTLEGPNTSAAGGAEPGGSSTARPRTGSGHRCLSGCVSISWTAPGCSATGLSARCRRRQSGWPAWSLRPWPPPGLLALLSVPGQPSTPKLKRKSTSAPAAS